MTPKKGTLMTLDEYGNSGLDAADLTLAAPGLDEHLALLATLLVTEEEVSE